MLTKKFRKMQMLSHISLAVTTEKSLLHSFPSIFNFDLIKNGKVIFGKNICKVLPNFEIEEIQNSDISKLLFNRMVESMDSVLPIIYLKNNPNQIEFTESFITIRKFIFSMIQSFLIKENILLFSFSELIKFKNQRMDYLTSIIPSDLLLIFDEINVILEFQKNYSNETLKNFWIKTINQFDLTFLRVFNVKKISSQSILNIMSNNDGFLQRIKISILLLLQYKSIRKNSEVFQTVIYSLSHNPYHIYPKLYKSFKSSSIIIENRINSSRFENSKNDGSNKNKKSFSIKKFQKYLKIWKMMYG